MRRKASGLLPKALPPCQVCAFLPFRTEKSHLQPNVPYVRLQIPSLLFRSEVQHG